MKWTCVPRVLGALIWVLSVGVAGATPGGANEGTLSPYFFVDGADPSVDALPLEGTDVTVNIAGPIADVLVTQTYVNRGKRPLHARYVFPASTRAAVHGLEMKIGERVVKAKIKERDQARKEFEASKRAGKSASLLEQDRPNVFSMNLTNILPGDRIQVKLAYTEMLVPTKGRYEFVYPTVVGPRYSNQPEASAPPQDRFVQTAYTKGPAQAALAPRFSLSGAISMGMELRDVSSPSHQLTQHADAPELVRFAIDPTEGSANRDFILGFELTGGAIQSGLSLFDAGSEKFFALLVEPPARVTPAQIPPREYVFILDVSGSMYGMPLDTAKRLMRELARGLRPVDRFNVLTFSGGSTLLAERSLPATEDNLEEALRTLDEERGGGGTELLPALKRALALPADEKTSRNFVVVTDGFIDADRAALDFVRKHLGRANVFAFGIGSSVNRYLIEGLARAGAGEPFIVTNDGEARGVADAFKQYIEAPVLTRVRVAYEGFGAYDVYPSSVPDVLAERPVTIFGKWRGKSAGSIVLTGKSGDATFESRFDVASVAPRPENAALRYLWARNQIAALSDFAPDPSDAERAKLVALGLKYNLLTRHTSFLAVSEYTRNPGLFAVDVDQPLPLPDGVSEYAVSGIEGAPEPELWVLLLGLASLAALWWALRARKERSWIAV